MSSKVILGWAACIAVLCSGLSAVDAQGKEKLKGKARWVWILKDGKKTIDAGAFKGEVDGGLLHDDKKIGSWTALDPDQIRMNFTDGPLAPGHALLKVTVNNPPRVELEGQLVRKKGKDGRLFVKLLYD